MGVLRIILGDQLSFDIAALADIDPARDIVLIEGARDMACDIATTDAYVVSRRQRKKVEMLFAHLKRILRLDRLRLADRTAQETNSTSQLQPKISANSQN